MRDGDRPCERIAALSSGFSLGFHLERFCRKPSGRFTIVDVTWAEVIRK
jgi:hypothetical protein